MEFQFSTENDQRQLLAQFRSTPIREYPRVPYWLFFKIYAFPHFDTEQWILSLTYWVGVSGAQKDIYGGQSETFLRRLQQELFSPLDTGNDQRQLLAQFPQHTNSGISSGALLVVIQCLPCDICFPPIWDYTTSWETLSRTILRIICMNLRNLRS